MGFIEIRSIEIVLYIIMLPWGTTTLKFQSENVISMLSQIMIIRPHFENIFGRIRKFHREFYFSPYKLLGRKLGSQFTVGVFICDFSPIRVVGSYHKAQSDTLRYLRTWSTLPYQAERCDKLPLSMSCILKHGIQGNKTSICLQNMFRIAWIDQKHVGKIATFSLR